MSDCPHLPDVELWLDGEAGERAEDLARHIAACSICKAHAESIRRLDFALRESGTRITAPPSLLERLADADATHPVVIAKPAPNRRRLLTGVAAAASVVAIASVAVRRGRSADLPMAVFGDFATHLDAGRDLDLTESNPERVMDWFSPKVPFALPSLVSLSDLHLVGGRLCWLLDRRIAAFNFDRGTEALGLYVTEATGLTCADAALPDNREPPTILAQRNLHGAFWRDGPIALALVGEPKADAIASLASLFRTGPSAARAPKRNPA